MDQGQETAKKNVAAVAGPLCFGCETKSASCWTLWAKSLLFHIQKDLWIGLDLG